MQYTHVATNILAVAYGEGSYACANYNDGCETQAISAPDTGFFSLPPEVLYPALFGVAILVAIASYTVSRIVKKYTRKKTK